MRKRTLPALLLIFALLLSGCWDMTEIEDSVFAGSIGIDPAEDGEYIWSFRLIEAEKLILGMLTAVPGDPGKLASGIISVRARNLQEAVQLVQPSIARVLSLEHVRWIGINEEVARQGLAPLVGQFLRHNQLRRGVSIYVFVGTTVNGFLSNRPVSDVNALKYFEGLRLVQKRFHLSPPLQLQHFYTRLMSPGVDPMAPLAGVNEGAKRPPGSELPHAAERSFTSGKTPRAGGNPNEFLGSGVFSGDRLVGVLNVDETQAVLALRGEMGKAYMSVPDPRQPDVRISLRIHQENKPRYRAMYAGSRPVVQVQLQLEGEILSMPGRTDYTLTENRRRLEQAVARQLEEETFAPMLARVYGEWGADPVGFGHLFRKRFPTHDAWLAYYWPKHIRDLKTTVKVELFIRRYGLLFGNPEFQQGSE